MGSAEKFSRTQLIFYMLKARRSNYRQDTYNCLHRLFYSARLQYYVQCGRGSAEVDAAIHAKMGNISPFLDHDSLFGKGEAYSVGQILYIGNSSFCPAYPICQLWFNSSSF
ncbi:hypothetical protein D3C71_1546960 [compost metagenome]